MNYVCYSFLPRYHYLHYDNAMCEEFFPVIIQNGVTNRVMHCNNFVWINIVFLSIVFTKTSKIGLVLLGENIINTAGRTY